MIGFWGGGFTFRDEQVEELRRLRLDDPAIAGVQSAINYVNGYYATNPPSRKERRDLPAHVHKQLAAAADALALLDPEIVDSIEAQAYPQSKKVGLAELKMVLNAYAEAAGRMAEFAASTPQTGPDAGRDTHLAVMIGEVLRCSGLKLSDSIPGVFVQVTGIVFAALGINKSHPRNDVRRALKYLENKAG